MKPGRLLLGTPLLAVTNEPYFTRLRFIELRKGRAAALAARLERYALTELDARVINEDCNAIIRNALSEFPSTWPTLILMDPEGLELDWTTIVESGEHPKSELMIVFPYGIGIQRVKGMEDSPPE